MIGSEKATYLKRPCRLDVTFAKANGTLQTLEGPVGFIAGDALVTGLKNERWPIERARFEATYEPCEATRMGQDGAYIKKPEAVIAYQVDMPLQIPIRQGRDKLAAKAGDWIITDSSGEQWVVADEVFRVSYILFDKPTIR